MAARHALSKGEDREETEKQQERGKDEEAETVLPMRDLSPQGQEGRVQVATCCPPGSCIQGPQRCPDPRRGKG